MNTVISNAEITGTILGEEDHGIFTCWISLDCEAGVGSFGGYGLDEWTESKKKRMGTAYGLEFIKRILTTVGVETWEKLKGTPVRIEHEGIGGRIIKLGHFRKDKWFSPDELLKEMNELELLSVGKNN